MEKLSLHQFCVNQGLVRGTPEYKRVYNREKYHRLPKEKQRKKWRAGYENRKKKIASNPEVLEKIRERDRIRKAKIRAKNKEAVNEYQRNNYREAGEARRRKIYEGRSRRNPERGLASLIQDVRNGRRCPRELIDAAGAALTQFRTFFHGGTGAGLSGEPTQRIATVDDGGRHRFDLQTDGSNSVEHQVSNGVETRKSENGRGADQGDEA